MSKTSMDETNDVVTGAVKALVAYHSDEHGVTIEPSAIDRVVDGMSQHDKLQMIWDLIDTEIDEDDNP